MFKHILIPTDGSETSLRAVEKGVELAKVFGSELTLMTVVEHISAGLIVYQADEENFHKAQREAALQYLDQAEQIAKAAGVPTQRLIMSERGVYQCILNAARSSNADLIVMGTRGLGALERLFVGSQTQRVLTHTTIPVLTLH